MRARPTFKVTVKEASSEQPGGDSSVPSVQAVGSSNRLVLQASVSQTSESSEPAGSSGWLPGGDHSMTLVLPVVSVLALCILGAAILALSEKRV